MNRSDNYVDLYKILLTLWSGKKLISIFIIISILIGAGIFFQQTPTVHTSAIKLTVKNNPIFSSPKEALLVFEKMFYSEELFDDWKKDNNSPINYEDFNREARVNRFVVSRTDRRMASFILRRNDAFIKVVSKELSIPSHFFDYSDYVNKSLKPELLLEAKRKLKLLEVRYEGRTMDNNVIIEQLSLLDIFISKINEGYNILEIKAPTIPQQNQKKIYRFLGIYAVIGLIIGSFFVLLQQAFRKRKENT